MSIKQSLVEAVDVARLQWRAFSVTVVVVAAVYFGSVLLAPGWVTYLLSLPAALVIALTALARVNDIGPEHMTWRWHVRRIALVLSGVAAVMVIASPLSEAGYAITWRGTVLIWGVAGVWLTTPGQPPWEDYITGKYREPLPNGERRNYAREFGGRITGTHKARRKGDTP